MSHPPPHIDPIPAAAREEPWICPTCARESTTSFCGTCGERRRTPRDLTFVALLGEAFESSTDTDGRAFRTFATLLRWPGELTAAYLRGERKRYIGPIQLFLIANVVFFFVQASVGFHTLSNNLDSHLNDQRYSSWLRPWAERALAERGTTVAEYAPVFDSAVDVNAKALAILMVPLFALLAWLLSPLRRKPVLTHVVFGLHFGAVFLLVLGVMIPLVGIPLVITAEALGLPHRYADVAVAYIAVIPPCVWYTHVAFGRLYGGPFWARALKAVAFAVLLIGVARVYRLIVFFVTFYTA
jgi:hypothetical protein